MIDGANRAGGAAGAAGAGGFLARLARDRRGNTLAIMAAALIPVLGLTGSAVDTARMYVVKVRLQQACDAGALAGRKTMDVSSSQPAPPTLDDNAVGQARLFFANNFPSGYMGTPAFTASTTPYPFTPSKTSDYQVAGTASVAVPMTLMKMFGQPTQTVTVTCQARYDVADTDVMFVLDTTGSMACGPSDPDSCGQSTVSYKRPDGTTGYKVDEKSNSRMSALRAAVLSFYDTVAANADASTHIRYGFVPYTSTVNAGAAVTSLSSSYMVNNWNYDTRHVVADHNQGKPKPYGNGTYKLTQDQCAAFNGVRSPAFPKYQTDGTAIILQTSWSSSNGGTCTVNQQTVTPVWRYENSSLDVSGYVATLGTSNTVTDPAKVTGATDSWQGCLEERDTTASASFDPANLPPDLDPDLVPSSDATRWRPMWPEVIYARTDANSVDDYGSSTNPYGDGDPGGYFYGTNSGPYLSTTNEAFTALYNGAYLRGGVMVCGKAAQRLKTMARSDVSDYVNAADFAPWGGTYHDTGMIWGTRMLSPSGIFAADTATWPGHNAPNRYLVFMTDGHMSTSQLIYGMYGWENYDKRVTGGAYANSDSYHNARFLAECQAAKNRNIKVYVVTLAATLDDNLKTCASPNAAYAATDSATLTAAFQTIAKQVAMLRISQ